MYNKKPPFEITTSILNKIAEVAELVGQVNAVAGLTTNPMLRRTNQIRTIYSSLAIEQNTLSLEQGHCRSERQAGYRPAQGYC